MKKKPAKNKPRKASAKIISLEQKRDEREAQLRVHMGAKEKSKHIVIGEAVLDAIKPVLFTKESLWRCQDNLWSMMTDTAARQWIDVEIEKQMRLKDFKSTKRMTDEARNWIYRNPDIRKDNIEWDRHGKVLTQIDWIDPVTNKTGSITPEMYATRRIDCEFNSKAKCPLWLELIDVVFDKDTIVLLQEVCGMSLINDKPKNLSKALVLWGASDTGKSVITSVLAGIISQTYIDTPISFLDNAHGTSAFMKDDPWVLHEAFNQGKWHFSDMVKLIIEGKNIPINRKNKDPESRCYRGAVFWATNHAPSFKEATKALVNRMIVIECKNVFKGPAIGVAKKALAIGYSSPNELILAQELPGLLNWALEGLRRALKRGVFSMSKAAEALLHEVYSESNLALGFIESGLLEFDPHSKISISDFCAAFSVWYAQERGEDQRLPANETISRALRALGDPRISVGEHMKSNGKRFVGGIKLSPEGLDYWSGVAVGKLMERKQAGLSPNQVEVNKLWQK